MDFDHLEDYRDAFAGCDVGFNCLGTTRSKSGGKVLSQILKYGSRHPFVEETRFSQPFPWGDDN